MRIWYYAGALLAGGAVGAALGMLAFGVVGGSVAALTTLLAGLLGTIIGGLIAFGGTYLAGRNQRELQQQKFDRDDAANRAIARAVLADAWRYAEATHIAADFDPAKLRPAADRLLSIVLRSDMMAAFGEDAKESVPVAAFEFDLACQRLSALPNPFRDLGRETPEIDRATPESAFLGSVAGIVNKPYKDLITRDLGESLEYETPNSLYDKRLSLRALYGLPAPPPPPPAEPAAL